MLETGRILFCARLSENVHRPERQTVLSVPTYGHPGPAPHGPTLRQVLVEWFDAVNFARDRTRLLPAVNALFHFFTGLVFVWFLAAHFSVATVVTVVLLACFNGTIYNTVWYHRYCSHQAFKFRSLWLARIFLWTNPLCLREEGYAIPHRIHHAKSDGPGDPYGPHLGLVGSYLAIESSQKTNLNLSAAEYERLARSLGHIGFVTNSHAQYRRTGSVENLGWYFARFLFAGVFWGALAWAVAGWWGVQAWLSGAFFFTLLARDFNYRGHSALTGARRHGQPVNHFLYGLVAGEWHENHHEHPRLARSGLKWWEVDAPYWIIRAMQGCGMVSQCNLRQPAEALLTPDAEIMG